MACCDREIYYAEGTLDSDDSSVRVPSSLDFAACLDD